MTSENSAPTHRSFIAAAREHPGLVITGGYLAATAVGMLSSWTFYRRFGLNIFDFAQVSDFLLVVLRQPLAALAILAAVPAVWLILRSDAFLDQRFGWYKYIYGPRRLRELSRTAAAMGLYVALYAYAFSIASSGYMEAQVRSGSIRVVEVQLVSGEYWGRDATVPFQANLLGVTSGFVFLYDPDSEGVAIVPLENLAFLAVK